MEVCAGDIDGGEVVIGNDDAFWIEVFIEFAMDGRTQRTSLLSPNRSRVAAKLTKASIDLRRGGVAPATRPRLRSFFNYVAAGRAIAVAH